MNKKTTNILKYLLFLGIGVFLVWWSLHKIPDNKWSEFKTALVTANFWLLIPVFFILTTSHILRAIRWNTLMKPMGYQPRIANTFFAVMIGYLANLAVPRLGEVLKCTLLAKYENVPAEKLVGTIVIERAVDVVCLALVFVFAFIIQYEVIGEFGKEILSNLFANKSGNFSWTKILIGVGVTLALILIIKVWFKAFAHLKIVIALEKIFKGIWEGLTSIRNVQQKGRFVFCTIGIWSLYIAGTWVGLYSTIGTAHLGFGAALSALAFASIGMIITPGGIGAYAIFLAKVLEKNDIPYEIGLANGTLQWFAQFLIVVIVGFISVGLLPWYNKSNHSHETN